MERVNDKQNDKDEMVKSMKNLARTMKMEWDVDEVWSDKEAQAILSEWARLYKDVPEFKKIMDEIGDFRKMPDRKEEIIKIVGKQLYSDMYYYLVVAGNALTRLFEIPLHKERNRIGHTRMGMINNG